MSKGNPNQKQQGDITFEKVDALPKGFKKVALGKGRIILAEGEVTGHHHAVAEIDAPKCQLFTATGKDTNLTSDVTVTEMFLEVKEGQKATVGHEEHGAVTLDAGTWRVGRIYEQDHAENLVRRVID